MLETAQQASFCRLSWGWPRRCCSAGNTEQLITTWEREKGGREGGREGGEE